ncbi:hypothetical protein [Yinghuangia seranimata]|uniref:hypothetical protein n=1 Tax=Yinghuangia seranimata TaxID=408067 RepID=UPI00248C2EC0|nr:hypothetical protein [Yinghuangia seranimata]MDI2126609.1 hypothetical protein [Yinghuangia seranimata]
MTIAGGLALIIIGAILRYALEWQPTWVDLDVLGTILMIGGAVGLAAGFVMTAMRRRRQAAAQVYEQRYYRDPPSP